MGYMASAVIGYGFAIPDETEKKAYESVENVKGISIEVIGDTRAGALELFAIVDDSTFEADEYSERPSFEPKDLSKKEDWDKSLSQVKEVLKISEEKEPNKWYLLVSYG